MKKIIALLSILLLAFPALAQTTFRSLPDAGSYNPATQTVLSIPATGNDVRTHLGSMSTQSASGVAVTGGTIDGVTIGGINPAAGTFTTLSATTNTPTVNCNTSNTTCAKSAGYVLVNDFPGHTGGGGVGGGSGDDEPVFANAAAAACASGNKLVKLNPGKYNQQQQFNSPCDGLVFFCSSENISYDPEGHPNASCLVYINSGFFTTANHIWYNANGKTDNVWWSINIAGDGGQQGISAFGTSFNYVGVGQIPRFYIFDSGIGGQGTAFGCGINTSGSGSTFATPYTGAGTTCSNYMGWRLFNVNVSENALAGNGNITDLFWRGGVISGNACGGIVGANAGTEGVMFDIDTVEENGHSGFSGVCAAAGPGLEINGPLWVVKTRFQANFGVDEFYDGNCADDVTSGSYSGSGLAGSQGAESIIAFNATCGKTISFTGFSGGSGVNGLTAPNYFAENILGNNQINFIGGNLDSTQYSISRDNIVAGSLAYAPILTLGQDFSTSGTTQNAGTFISSSTLGTTLNLNNSSSGGHNFSITSAGSGTDGGAGEIRIADESNSGVFAALGYASGNSFYRQASTGLYCYSSTSDAAAAADTCISRDSAAVFDFGNATQGNKSGTINATTINQNGVQVISAAGTGLGKSTNTLNSNDVDHISYQTGLITALNATKAVFHKFSKASTVDNIEGSASTFSCVGNPIITVFECGTSATCASSPVTIGTVTVTAAGTVADGTVSNASITAGDYVAFAETSGTCASSNIAVTVQVHQN